MDNKSIAQGRKKSEKGELSEFKILSYRILDKGYVKWFDPVVDVVQAKGQ